MAPSHFLGIELATDQLRAAVVDDQLDLVAVEAVDFDSELPEFQTQGGIFTTPGDAYTTPVEMWVKGLDLLLEKLRKNFDLSKIKSVGGAAQHACVWWKSGSLASLSRLNPSQPLHAQLCGNYNVFTLPHTPVAQDTSTLAQAQALEAALGGPDVLAVLTGAPAHASLPAAQALRVRETLPDAWVVTARITLASTFLASLLLGNWAPASEAEACATGMWAHKHSTWDETVLQVVAGSREEAARLRLMLGAVDSSGGGRKIGNIAQYYVDRYGFSSDTILTTFMSDQLSTYLSLCPSPTDAVLSFGPMDTLLTAAPTYLPSRLYTLFPHPAQDPSEKRRYIAMLMSRNGDVPRALVRDMYTKSWSAFDRLIAIVPPGGSIGLDDKLFSFWLLQGESAPLAHVKGIFRFETGIKVGEFRDLRANPRCLLESQLLSFRVRHARMRTSPLFSPAHRAPGTGAAFDPYSTATLPKRVLATGAAANFSSVANLLGDVFNAPVFVPATQLESARVAPHRNTPAPGCVARAALGGAYAARWVWARERAAGGGAGAGAGAPRQAAFEDEVRQLLARRWVAAGGAKAGARGLGLGSTVLVEEDEDEDDAGAGGGGVEYLLSNGAGAETPPRMRTATGSSGASFATGTSGALPPSTAFTSPDLAGVNGAVPTGVTPLTPVAALPTADAEAQLGLAKVAEPDTDAFMAYASIVPEFCRLEAMLVKSLV